MARLAILLCITMTTNIHNKLKVLSLQPKTKFHNQVIFGQFIYIIQIIISQIKPHLSHYITWMTSAYNHHLLMITFDWIFSFVQDLINNDRDRLSDNMTTFCHLCPSPLSSQIIPPSCVQFPNSILAPEHVYWFDWLQPERSIHAVVRIQHQILIWELNGMNGVIRNVANPGMITVNWHRWMNVKRRCN